MDQYRQLATLLLRCFTQKLEDYQIFAFKGDNTIYLIQKSWVIELPSDSEEYPGVRGTVDYIVSTKSCVADNSLPSRCCPDFILASLYKVDCDNSINLYVSDSFTSDFDLELLTFCIQREIKLVNTIEIAQDFCRYVKDNIMCLTERNVIGTLFYLCLRQYCLQLNFDEYRYNHTWDDVISKQRLIIVHSSCQEFLRLHAVGAVLRRTQIKCNLTNVYKNLWLSNEVSLLLRVDSLEDFQNFVNISETFGLEVRVTIASNCLEVIEKGVCTRSLMNFDVSVQGRFTIKLGDIFGETINYSDVIRVLSEKTVIFQPLPKYYVERSFLKVILSLDALKELNDEFFVVRSKVDNGKELLKGLVKQELKNVHVVDDDEEFELEVPRHYVNFYGENWVEWKKSSGDVENLRAYDISSDVNKRFTMSELIQEEREAVVICGGAGMGKSVVLQSIANALSENCWVELVDLCQITHPVSNDLVFRYFVAQKRAHVLIDGFDEASGALQSWLDLGCKVWIVARPANARVLENRLKTISVELKPFTERNRRDFLIRYFGENEFASELFKILENVFGEFMQNPLHLRIMTDCFDEHYRKFEMSGVLNLEVCPDVLDAFIQTRTDLLCARYGEKIQAFVKHLALWALTVIFEKTDLVHLNIEQRQFEESLNIFTSEALVEGNRFKHVLFDEYLAAKWIFANRESKDRNVKRTFRILFKRRFSDLQRFGGVFTMFDRIMAKDCPLHIALIQGKSHLVQSSNTLDAGGRNLAHIAALYGKRHSETTSNLRVDTEDKMVGVIRLSEDNLLIAEDSLLRYNALDYALATGTLAVANAICERLPNLSTAVFAYALDLKTYFDYCTKVGAYIHLFKYLLQYTLIHTLVEDTITPNFTVKKFVSILQISEVAQEYVYELDASLVIHLLEAFHLKTANADTYTDLLLACAYGKIDNVVALITEGALISRLRYLTPLHVAVIHKRKEIVDLLLSLGAKVNARNTSLSTPLHLACKIHSNVPIIEKLLQHGAIPDLANEDGDTPLHYALKANIPDAARLFLPKKRQEMLLSTQTGDYSRPIDLNGRNVDGETPLMLAIQQDQMSLARELLRSHVDVIVPDNKLYTCLHYAAQQKDVFVIRELIYRHAYVNERNEEGDTPLVVALKLGRTAEVVRVLMANGADVNVSDCLHYAVTWGRVQIVKDLLERGADINKKNQDGVPVLMHAITNNRTKVAVFLIRQGADVNAVDDLGSSVLHRAALLNERHVIRELVSRGAEIDKHDSDGNTPLLIALKNSHVAAVKILLSLGADVTDPACLHLALSLGRFDVARKFLVAHDVNCLDSEGNTPLIISMKHATHKVTRLLLNSGADIFATNKSGLSALHYAAKFGFENFLTELIRRGADVNQETKSGDTPLLLHVMENSRKGVVKLLIDNGADVCAVEAETGNSCMHYLVDKCEIDVIGDLAKAGADINVRNRDGNTPLHCAVRFGNCTLVKLLLSFGADSNVHDSIDGNTCLHWAVALNRDDYVQVLVEYGADVNSKNNNGETPLVYARRFGRNNHERIMTDTGRDFTILCQAVKKGSIYTVRKLLKDDFDIDKKNDDGETLLMIALRNGEVGVADYLIARGASLNLRNNRGVSSLHYAASTGDIINVRRHLDSGVDVDITDNRGDTPFIIACYSRNRHVVELLLSMNARLELSPLTNPKQTCLHFAVEAGWDNVVSQILDSGFYVDKRNSNGSTALLKAIHYKYSHIATLLLERGADPAAADESRATCLHLAAVENMIDMVQVLLEKGVDVNKRDSQWDTPLINAIECENRAITKLLLSVPEVDVHTENFSSYPLHLAAHAGWNDVVLEIIERGFNIETENIKGDTPLFSAFLGKQPDTARIIWKKGPRIDMETCLHFAIDAGCEHIVQELLKLRCFDVTDECPRYNNIAKMLLEHIISLEQLENEHEHLHFAASFADFGIMSKLLDRGLDINLENKNGETPLIVAFRERRWMIAELLMSRGADVNTTENENERTCLHYVAGSVQDKLMVALLEKGCDVNAQQRDGSTALMEAIWQKKYVMVKELLDHGADPNISNDDGRNALHYASETNSKILIAVIDKIVDVNERSGNDQTALLIAVHGGRYDLARIILEHGALDLPGEDGNTCLHYAAANGIIDLIELIVYKLGNIDCVNHDGNTPLMLAYKHNQDEAAHLLLHLGADISLINNDGNSCILLVPLNDHHTKNTMNLMERGANVFSEDTKGNTCLHLAAASDDDALMLTLLAKGFDPNKKNNEGDNCLQVAIQNSSMKVMKMLLDMGCDPATVSVTGKTCLICAIEQVDEQLWSRLLAQNVDVNVQTDYEVTPLWAAIENGLGDLAKRLIAMGCDVNVRRRSGSYLHLAVEHQVDIIGELIAAGLDVNQQDENGYTPLCIALKFKNAHGAMALLDLGADPNLNNNDGVSCLHHAVIFHEEDIVLRLLTEGVSINVRSSCGNTPLLHALQHQKLDNAKLLLEHGANFDVRNCKGNSSLHYAAKYGFDDLVKELIEKGDDVDKYNYRDFTPLLAALGNSQPGTAKLLLKNGADPTIHGRWKFMALDFIIATNDIEFTEMAVKKGADIDAGLRTALTGANKKMSDFFIAKGADLHSIDDKTEESCLHLAARVGFDDIVIRLLDEGLDINRLNFSKETPLRVAFLNLKFTTAKLLLSRGAITPPESFNYSYLHYAAEAGDADLTSELIARGLNLECKSEDGDTPLFLAVKKGQINTTKVLLEHGAYVYGFCSEGYGLLHYANDDIKALLVKKGLVNGS
ncbi:hypothetical protein FQR65_LT14532 [Abscondita terminalis]|nr:hypothetical protein FQR65_LT14532 [Abscondita terminalis]